MLKSISPKQQEALDRELFSAIQDNNCKAVAQTLNQGANIHAEDGYALCLAAHHGLRSIAEILLKAGANVQALDNTPLIYASRGGHLPFLIKCFLDREADIHARHDEAIIAAAAHGHMETV